MADTLAHRGRTIVSSNRRVQRRRAECEIGSASFDDLVYGHADVAGQFRVSRGPAEIVRKFGDRAAQLQPQLLQRSLDVHEPALVAEVALDLAAHAWLRVARQRVADLG